MTTTANPKLDLSSYVDIFGNWLSTSSWAIPVTTICISAFTVTVMWSFFQLYRSDNTGKYASSEWIPPILKKSKNSNNSDAVAIIYRKNFLVASNILFLTEEILNNASSNPISKVQASTHFIDRHKSSMHASAIQSTKVEASVWFDRYASAVETLPQIAIFFTAFNAASVTTQQNLEAASVAQDLFKNLAIGIGLYLIFYFLISMARMWWGYLYERQANKWAKANTSCILKQALIAIYEREAENGSRTESSRRVLAYLGSSQAENICTEIAHSMWEANTTSPTLNELKRELVGNLDKSERETR